jgi:acetyl-CoA carboxylase biotin carboxyl carrier protein
MTEVRAELVGNLWKIVTEVGQQVDEDDTLMILESMKMEIPITSPVAGTVREIRVAEGDVVQEGQVVAVVEEG